MTNVLEYLEMSANDYPDKTAVSYVDESYSFSQLKLLSQRLGNTIDRSGKRNCPIGVIADRKITTLVYFFACVYSGNYYVPIDPEMPEEKKRMIIDDAGLETVLGDVQNRQLLQNIDFSGKYLSVEDASDELCEMPDSAEDTPLYMVYTSGSTGKPKGVLKSHKSVISFMEAYCGTFDFSPEDIIGNQTQFFFDASAKDIYLMLKTGATMEIIPTQHFAMPTDLIEFMNKKKITFISWVPTALSIVSKLRIFSFILPETLRKVFFVGEVMPMKHLNYWRKYLPDVQFVNLYGQSELAGICCYYEVRGEFENSETLPMGKTLSNCKIYLIDNGELVTEPNRQGEMYIVSDALALEYYNDTEKTEKSFLMKDFGEGEVRCFKTGDLASFDEEGNFIFASRADFQIKHMGHRIELGEIEAIAGSLDDIQRCCCLYNQEKQKIVLFCELSDESQITKGQEIQSKLRDKLSSYMLPAKVNIFDKLPLNPNGKIDRQKLKAEM